MKIPGRELAITLVGLAVLVAAWALVFMSTQEHGRSVNARARPKMQATEEAAPSEEPAEKPAEESAADVTEKPAE